MSDLPTPMTSAPSTAGDRIAPAGTVSPEVAAAAEPLGSEPALRSRLSATIDRIAPTRDERLFLVLSIFIGVLSGLLVVAFRIAIEWIKL
ncbi:MAG: hypothetical protein WB622_15270, partial [Acidobacteriaceae bacterium]